MSRFPAIVRPNGKVYRPRKIQAEFMVDDGMESGVIVFGTHDLHIARRLADRLVMSYDSNVTAVDPQPCWIYRGISCGSIYFYHDEVRGRAAVQFPELVEVPVLRWHSAEGKHDIISSEEAAVLLNDAILNGVPSG